MALRRLVSVAVMVSRVWVRVSVKVRVSFSIFNSGR